MPMGRTGAGACERVKRFRLTKWENSRASTGSERSGSDTRDNEVRVLLVARHAKFERPVGVMPGRSSSLRDLRGGSEINVESLNAGVGKEETCKFSMDGTWLQISANNRESIVPPGLLWRMRVFKFDQFEW